MNKYFSIKDKVYDITEKYPETIDVFVSQGFTQLANEKMRKLMGKTITLEMALKTKKVNVELFTQKLIDVIEQNRESIDDSLTLQEEKKEAGVRISGVLPCPVRIPLMDSFNKWMEEEGKRLNISLAHELKAASSGVDWLKDEIERAETEESLSDIFISAGFDLFFDNSLMKRFKDKGTFEDITGLERLNEDFQNENIDLQDPDREYSIIGVVPAVFLINKEEVEGDKIPTSWADLLEPEFENRVSLPISDFDLFNAILLNIYKLYGEEGIKKLGKSLFRGMHPSEMVKSHMKSKRPAITIMPYFFTKMIREGGPMQAIWPEDGAIISPIFLLSKKSKKDILKPFVQFFASKEVGEILSHNGRFPSTNPEVDNGISEDKRFIWLGWDFIKENDIGKLIEECERIFNESI